MERPEDASRHHAYTGVTDAKRTIGKDRLTSLGCEEDCNRNAPHRQQVSICVCNFFWNGQTVALEIRIFKLRTLKPVSPANGPSAMHIQKAQKAATS